MLDDRAKMMAYKALSTATPSTGGRLWAILKSLAGFKKHCYLDVRGLVCLLHPLAGK